MLLQIFFNMVDVFVVYGTHIYQTVLSMHFNKNYILYEVKINIFKLFKISKI